MITRVSFSIDDSKWPRLRIFGERIGHTGERAAFEQVALYDQAYLQFENMLHNQLRPCVEEIVSRRKQAAQ